MRTLAPPVAGERPTPHPRAPARRAALLALLPALLLTLPATAEPPADPYAAQRHALVDALREEHDPRLSAQALAVMEQVPRHLFVPEDQRDEAYENRPLGIGYGQTISQPYIVALMTSLARPARDQRILEIGTGSGYQAAVLGAFGAQVYSMEIIEPLARAAAPRLQAWPNVHTRVGDGYYGWPEHAPFDAIVVTAAAGSVPPPLVAQLKPGGRMVIPVGGSFFTQVLMVVEKDASGLVSARQIAPVRFVPLTRSD
ncbi:protein-L-isoaspartate(D-aspartate) O-methyltransferase [Agrilutibacter solisilvae]|uniref:Protein-L-isoaspartate O-methyltransferase n=1 Tax=Agrilutibacter solisilvae TaxID=2763317 RepID=A0A974Y0U5_9GAMM|nr:protein-L-isoaspartate(D-aspartate) O-methyltransferase [Lysobacter solisilvae]QSX79356.1 protein-L-isoaspartate(D-aspartate) O-methyltransferase [Lysobacter solisilvae]